MKLKYMHPMKKHFYRNEVDYSKLLTKGKDYVALGISFSEIARYVCLETNDGMPALLDIRQFEVVSNYLPSRWSMQYTWPFDRLSFFPQSWVDLAFFWEGLFEKQKLKIFKLYWRERDLIFKEEPQ